MYRELMMQKESFMYLDNVTIKHIIPSCLTLRTESKKDSEKTRDPSVCPNFSQLCMSYMVMVAHFTSNVLSPSLTDSNLEEELLNKSSLVRYKLKDCVFN